MKIENEKWKWNKIKSTAFNFNNNITDHMENVMNLSPK